MELLNRSVKTANQSNKAFKLQFNTNKYYLAKLRTDIKNDIRKSITKSPICVYIIHMFICEIKCCVCVCELARVLPQGWKKRMKVSSLYVHTTIVEVSFISSYLLKTAMYELRPEMLTFKYYIQGILISFKTVYIFSWQVAVTWFYLWCSWIMFRVSSLVHQIIRNTIEEHNITIHSQCSGQHEHVNRL